MNPVLTTNDGNRAFPQLVEKASGEVMRLLIDGFNDNLEKVYNTWKPEVTGPINLPKIPVDKMYISDAVEALTPPAIFVIADQSEHSLGDAQNVAKQRHRMFVAILGYDVEIQRLTRMAWRYGAAAWMTLHDKNMGTIHVLVRRLDYSPTYRARGGNKDAGNRAFRKDVTVELEVLQYERFQTYP